MTLTCPAAYTAKNISHYLDVPLHVVNILQTGTYCSSNKGDAAMEFSLAQALQSHLAGVSITISTPFPELDRDTYSPITVVRCNRRRLIWGSFLVMRAWLWRRMSRWLGTSVDFLISNSELQATRDADLVVDLSGDMLTEDYGPHVAYSHFLPILIAQAMQTPYMICAQSIGPFKYTRAVARRVLGGAALITAREEITRHYLYKLGISEGKVVTTADMAFLLKSASDHIIDSTFRQERINSDGKSILGISLSNLAHNHYRKRNPKAAGTEFTSMFAGILDTIASQYNYQIVFVPHVTGPRPSADDRIFAERISRLMHTSATVIQGDYTPDILKGIISQFDLYMGTRMHANIAALTSGIPTLAIAYSHKTDGIMQLFDQSEFVCDIATLDANELLDRFKSLYDDRENISHILLGRTEKLKARAFHNIELIENLLQSAVAETMETLTPSGHTRA